MEISVGHFWSFLAFRTLHIQHLTLPYTSMQQEESTLGSLPSSISKIKMFTLFITFLCLFLSLGKQTEISLSNLNFLKWRTLALQISS